MKYGCDAYFMRINGVIHAKKAGEWRRELAKDHLPETAHYMLRFSMRLLLVCMKCLDILLTLLPFVQDAVLIFQPTYLTKRSKEAVV